MGIGLKEGARKNFLLRGVLSFVLTIFVALVMMAPMSATACAADATTPTDAVVTTTVAFVPGDLTLTVGATTSQMDFNWFSDAADSTNATVKIQGMSAVTGAQGAVTYVDGKDWNKVTINGLKPATTYTFQVSSNGVDFSQAYTFTTTTSGNFTFAAVGDPQMGAGNLPTDTTGWAATVAEIMGKGVSFIAGTGDQVNDSGQSASNVVTKENEYGSFFAGLNQSGTLVPFAPALGNHEGDGSSATGAGRALYGYHYNTPNAATEVVNGFTLCDYYYLQDNVLFVVLDTAAYPANAAAAKPFIDAYSRELTTATTACAGQYDWIVVQTHKSEMSNADHNNDSDINAYSQAGFEDLMTKYSVDLVLTGHDHSYVRTYPLTSNGGPLATNGVSKDQNNLGDTLINPVGTVYMVLDSASGSKFYEPKIPPKYTSKIEYQSDVPEYTLVNVTGNKLGITTYEVGGKVVDSFSITKTSVPTRFTVASVSNANGQADVNFSIHSANGKGYTVYLSDSGATGTFKPYTNVNYNASGAHLKGLTNGKTYYVYVEYANGSSFERSDTVTINPSK